MNENCNILIDALHKGRELFPKQGRGNLFEPGGTACALGAIAIGLGYEPSLDDLDKAYDFLDDKFKALGFKSEDVTKIYRVNDSAPSYVKGYDRDADVIAFIEKELCQDVV